MFHNRLQERSKGTTLLPAISSFAVAFLIFAILMTRGRHDGLNRILVASWVAMGLLVAALLVARPFYVLLGLVAFAPFYPVVRRLAEHSIEGSGMILGSWQDVLLGLLVIGAIVRILKNKRKQVFSGLGPGDIFLGALGLWAGAGLIGDGDWFSTLYGFRYTYMFVLLYFAVLLTPLKENQILAIQRVLRITLLASALFGIALVASDLLRGTRFAFDFQMYFGGKADLMRGTGGRLIRFGSTFILSHGAAPAYILLAILGLAAHYYSRDRRGSLVFLIALLAMATTMSRAAMGAMFVSGLVFLCFLTPHKSLFGVSSLPITAVLAVVLVGSVVFFKSLTLDYFLKTNSGDSIRQNQFLMALDASRDYPLGHGTGTAGSSVAIASKYLEGTFTDDTNVSDSFHLKVLYELGYPGLTFWTCGLLLTIGSLWKRFRSTQDARASSLLAVAISYLIAISIYSLTSNQLEIWPTKIYFWLVPALATLASQRPGNDSDVTSDPEAPRLRNG